jgi:hypothetical protein
LGAVPKGTEKSRIELAQGNTLGARDDEGKLIKAPAEVQLPEIPDQWTYLLGLFFLSGQAIQTGMGLAPISWQEIKAFIEVNDLDLMLFEKELLKKMSEAYCAESHRATDPHRPAPYVEEKEEDEIDRIAQALSFMERMRLLRGNNNEP